MQKFTTKSTRTKLTPSLFWHSIDILINKPHVVNKRLWGCKIWLRLYCQPVDTSKWNLPTLFSRLESNINTERVEEFLDSILRESGLVKTSESKLEVIFTELYPKSFSQVKVFQLIFIDKKNLSVTFYDISQESYSQKLCPNFPFLLQLKDEAIELTASCGESILLSTSILTIILTR